MCKMDALGRWDAIKHARTVVSPAVLRQLGAWENKARQVRSDIVAVRRSIKRRPTAAGNSINSIASASLKITLSTMSTIALLGFRGQLAKPIVDAVTSPEFAGKYQLPVRVLTRTIPDDAEAYANVKFYKVDATDVESLKPALEGVHALLNLTAFDVSADALLEAAVATGVQVYFPSDFGISGDHYNKSFIAGKNAAAAKARAAGIPKVVRIYNGVFLEFVTDYGLFGPNPETGELKVYGDGNHPLATTALADVGKSVASLAYRSPSELPDSVRLASEVTSVNKIVAEYEKASGKKAKVEYDPDTKAILAKAEANEIPPTDFFTILYALATVDTTTNFVENERELVNPGLWTWKTVAGAFAEKYKA
ncbi:uncharacterized protein V1510DRAFT_416537 [Dipodascopsis tothii]|uniref:uncharacterized protein n=1 Tax=Dipodascopsis tothii TaxID=44089 RepID=UPI0034CF6E17